MSVGLPGVVGVGVPEVGDVVVHGHRVEQHPPRLHLLHACERCLTMFGTESVILCDRKKRQFETPRINKWAFEDPIDPITNQ